MMIDGYRCPYARERYDVDGYPLYSCCILTYTLCFKPCNIKIKEKPDDVDLNEWVKTQVAKWRE